MSRWSIARSNPYSAFVLVVAFVVSAAYFWVIRAFTKQYDFSNPESKAFANNV